MAAATMSQPLDPVLGRSADFVRPDFHQVNLDIEAYLKTEKGMKLDSDKEICRLNLLPPGCPLGPTDCPYRHTQPGNLNFKPPSQESTTVCRHWLRGLCKLGPSCPFSHVYDLRSMPICWVYQTYGVCRIGSECLYKHLTPDERRLKCPDYERGFCKRGPNCQQRHIRKTLCGAYAAGFCPDGPRCKAAHPSPNLPPPEAYVNPIPPDPTKAPQSQPVPTGYGRVRDLKWDPHHEVVPDQIFREGGSLGSWRAGGVMSGSAKRGDQDDEEPRQRRKTGWVKDLSTVLCFKCNQMGHFANACPNQGLPGDRGGLYRGGRSDGRN